MNSVEIQDKKNQLKIRCQEIVDSCKLEIREMTDDEKKEFEANKEEIVKLNEELKSLQERLAEYEKELPTDEEKEETVEEEENNENNKRSNITMKKEENFSLVKAIRSIANNTKMDAVTEAVVNAGANEMRKAGLNYTGQIQLPSEETRAAITVATEGEDVVATDLMSIIKPLQSRNVLAKAGAKFVTGLVSDVQYPVMSKMNCAWADETSEATEGNVTFTNIKLSPKRLSVVVPISKQLLVQDSIGVENAIREEIINAINAKLEATILGAGAGSANEPKGFFPSEGDGSLTAVTDFAKVCELESELEDINGELKYLVSPKAKAALRNMAKSTKSTQLVMEGGEVDGTPALCTSHLTDKHVIVGDFNEYIIANWGNLDIVVDGYTLAASGQIRLVVNSYWDAKPLRPEAFKIGKIGA